MYSALSLLLILYQTPISISQIISQNYNAQTLKNGQKYIDIYTNYPNLEEVLNEEKLSHIFNENSSRRHDIDVELLHYKNENKSDFRANYRPSFVQIQSRTFLDSEPPENLTEIDQEITNNNTEIFEHENNNYRSLPKPYEYTHVQKILKNSTNNSKQLENQNENFFTKIHSVIRNQFARLFKFGKQQNNVEKDKHLNGIINKVDSDNARGPPKEDLESLNAKKRFLNIFTILQFDNSKCTAQAALTTYEGQCFHRFECVQKGGIALGACARGYGVCCVFRYSCNGMTSQNVSYFECNPGNNAITVAPTTIPTALPTTTGLPIDPRLNTSSYILDEYHHWGRQSSTSSTCIFTVSKRTSEVKQLRIDFEDLDIRGPTNGTCSTDRLVISGGNINSQIPIICGYNTGQHVYVDVSDTAGPIQLSVFTANPDEKRFRIKVSQIRAPCANFMNCLQYYTGITGQVQTFNYDPSPRGLGPATYFNNLNYAICIRKEPGYCSITYTNVNNGAEFPFRLTNIDSRGNALIPPNQAGVEIFNCPDDYIAINGIRLCGDKLNDGSVSNDFRSNAPVTDFSGGPFVLPVRTNGNTVARGFKLFYRQNRCTTV